MNMITYIDGQNATLASAYPLCTKTIDGEIFILLIPIYIFFIRYVDYSGVFLYTHGVLTI